MKRGCASAVPRAVEEAAQWYALMLPGELDEGQRRAWERWLAADPAHADAWGRVMAMAARMERLPGRIAAPVLSATSMKSRRSALLGLAGLFVAAGTTWSVSQTAPLRAWRADYRTATGERREWLLADGSRLLLDSASAVDLDFNDHTRRILLRAGRVMVSTHPDFISPSRPFLVQTPHGTVRALGTRFSVELAEGHSRVAVLEKAVEVSPAAAPLRVVRVDAGEASRFTAELAEPPLRIQGDAEAWSRGQLVVLDMPLGEFLAELGRYRPGYLGCDPALAGLKVSGVFPADDSDAALASLAAVFPLHIRRRTRYWTRLERREG